MNNIEKVKRAKWAVITIYSLLLAVAAAIYIVMVVPVSKDARIGNYIDDIVLPLGIFILFTVVQVVTFGGGSFKEGGYVILLALAIIKAAVTFGAEFALDFLNINFSRGEYVARSVLMISFMVLIFAAAAAEIIILLRVIKERPPQQTVACV